MKSGRSVRLHGDYKVTVNKVSHLDAYSIVKIEEVHNKLTGGKTFTELDLSYAYEQMVLDDQSKELLTINTHRGLYRYNRLPYGVSSAPGIFQRTMESLLKRIPYTGFYLITLGFLDQQMKNTSEVGGSNETSFRSWFTAKEDEVSFYANYPGLFRLSH